MGRKKSTAETQRGRKRQMKAASCLLAFHVLCFAQTAVPKSKPPKLLLQILHCAETNKYGEPNPSLKHNSVLHVAWSRNVDPNPEIGEEFFVVLYKSAKTGDVLVYARDYEKGKLQLHLVNNSGFSGGPNNLELRDPLGGIWTYNHIKRNASRAMRGQTYLVPAKNAIGPYPDVGCHWYSVPE